MNFFSLVFDRFLVIFPKRSVTEKSLKVDSSVELLFMSRVLQ